MPVVISRLRERMVNDPTNRQWHLLYDWLLELLNYRKALASGKLDWVHTIEAPFEEEQS